MKLLYFFFVVLLSFSIQSQTISGTVTDEKGSPIADVSVFFDNSTIETMTKSDGSFTITIPENNRKLLVFSGFGYRYYVVENPKPQDNLQINLQLDDNELEELVINRAVFSRKKFLKAFRHFFLGKTSNARGAKIINEEVLSFFYDKSTNTFYAYADQPIKVDNKKLAYDIIFHLETFEVHYRTLSLEPSVYSSSHFLGYMQYRDKANGSKKSIKNRQKTYDQSSMSFFRELLNHEIGKGTFFLVVNGLSVEPKDYFDINKTETGYQLILQRKPVRKKPVYSKKSVVNGVFDPNIVTDYEEVEVPFVVLNRETKERSQLYLKTQEIKVDKNGNLQNPNDVFFSGYFGELKVADMLPLDYQPMNKPKKETLETDDLYTDFEEEALQFFLSKEYIDYVKLDSQFLERLNSSEVFDNQLQFEHWIDNNIEQTNFETKEEALVLYLKREDIFKKIKDRHENLKRKENILIEKYGDEFKNKFYPKVASKLLNRKTQ